MNTRSGKDFIESKAEFYRFSSDLNERRTILTCQIVDSVDVVRDLSTYYQHI